MSWRQMKVLELVDFEKEPPLSISDWLTTTRQLLAGGAGPFLCSASGPTRTIASGSCLPLLLLTASA